MNLFDGRPPGDIKAEAEVTFRGVSDAKLLKMLAAAEAAFQRASEAEWQAHKADATAGRRRAARTKAQVKAQATQRLRAEVTRRGLSVPG